ncbi:MAG TPA: O-antigen ligase family protein [Candidatus Nanoarchaeia archaeon]|nr:O-antigen ligase family protein [Candidatus Nanoarchaeia archaeon]
MESIKKLFNIYFFLILAVIIVVELMSFFGHIFLAIDHWVFAASILIALILTLRNLKYGVWIILLELFIGSQGYLLSIDFGGLKISLRIALWLIVLSVWFKNYLFSFLDKRRRQPSIFADAKIFSTANFSYFLILFFFIALAGLIGCARGNAWQNVFFDANGWLFFLLIFPFYETFLNPAIAGNDPFRPVWRLFAAGTTWISLKTLLLFFFFTHPWPENALWHWLLSAELYQWVRDTLIGEITLMPTGLVRVFIQSQIYLVIALFLGLFALSHYWNEIKKSRGAIVFAIAAGTLLLSAIIISLSRSFWLGAAAVFLAYICLTVKNYGWKISGSVAIMLIVSFILSLALIFTVARFPFPQPAMDFDLTEALAARADQLNNEAALSSRYALLPPLWQKISHNPIWGDGFGTTVTYRASDPRILSENQTGTYTTYAFEWGWLDIWLKLGLFGLLAYLLLILMIIKDALKIKTWLSWGLGSGILLITIISFFSPYANHPLGIGFLLLSAAAIYHERQDTCAGA